MRRMTLCVLLFTVALATSCRTCTETPKHGTGAEREISWQEAKRLLAGGPIDSVGLSHARRLDIRLRGVYYLTTVPEPEVDWVWNYLSAKDKARFE